MRRPGALLRDLGWRRFLGFQALFLGAISQALLAPVLWSFWIAVLGLGHPLIDWMGPATETVVLSFFLLAECAGLVIGATAVASPQHRGLIPWVPTLLFYFPMGSIAIYKGLIELLIKPFYWDKTEHGHSNSEALIDHREAAP